MTTHPGSSGITLDMLGVTDSPMTRRGLDTALRFFRLYMPELKPGECVSYLKGIDLHKEVSEVKLSRQDQLIAFRQSQKDPFGRFYSRVGVGMDRLAINPHDRRLRRFQVVRRVRALQSICAPAWDTWSDERLYFEGRGGGVQLIVADPRYALELVGS